MSKYEWERGEIVIPRNQWKDFRTALISRWNELQEEKHNQAVDLKGELDEVIKGKRQKARTEALEDYLVEHDADWELVNVLVASRDPLKLKNPKKKDFPPIPTSKSCAMDIGEASIVLDNDDRTVNWDVPENNHACDDARKHPLAKLLFNLLYDIDWGRKSGGKIIGNDEYNRDDDEDEGGANYVNDAFGPLGAP